MPIRRSALLRFLLFPTASAPAATSSRTYGF
jgi:hypothetical protein